MRRIVTVLLIAVFLVASTAPVAHAGGHGHGPGRGVIGLAAFAIFAPFIIVGEVLPTPFPGLSSRQPPSTTHPHLSTRRFPSTTRPRLSTRRRRLTVTRPMPRRHWRSRGSSSIRTGDTCSKATA